LEVLPNGDILVLTWRGSTGDAGVDSVDGKPIDKVVKRSGTGSLYRYSNLQGPGPVTSVKIADKFKDAHGLAVVDGEIYVGDLDRIVKLVDKDKNGVYEEQLEIAKLPSYDGWFEYAFGPVYKAGKLYMALAVGVQKNGWPTTQFGPDRSTVLSVPIGGGPYTVVAQGLRAPDGIALGPDDELFVSDNQGSWRGSSAFFNIRPERFYGYMVDPPGKFQDRPVSPPAVWTPHGEVNSSPTEMRLLRGGPYQGQFVFGDITTDILNRIFLEKVGGEYQGCVFQFSGSLGTHVHRIRTGDNGEIWLGGLAFYGATPGRILKLTPKPGVVPFEMLTVRSRRKGMEIEFSKPLGTDAALAAKYQVKQWGYPRVPEYQSAKVDQSDRKIISVQLSADKKRVFLETDALKTGQVVEIQLKDLRSAAGDTIWQPKAWYTLNAISDTDPFTPATSLLTRDKQPDGSGFALGPTLNGGLRVSLPAGETFRVSILDTRGKVVEARDGVSGTLVLPGGHFQAGLHVVQAQSATRTWSRKVLF
jgi:hypothetical protein